MKYALYVESSALVAAMFDGDATARRAILAAPHRVASALTIAESRRAVVRAAERQPLRMETRLAFAEFLREFEAKCLVVSITADILARVGRPFAVEPVRTLDAIHLATVELIDRPPELVHVLTRDRRVADNARAMGCRVV